MKDPIERQAAIDAIKTCGLLDGLSEGQAIEILADEEKLPSVQPEPQWIPCSERLPQDRQKCLICVNCKNGKYVIDIASYAIDLFKVNKYDFWDEVGKSGWYYLNAEYGYCKVLNVIAWMPLPEPYREEGEKQ